MSTSSTTSRTGIEVEVTSQPTLLANELAGVYQPLEGYENASKSEGGAATNETNPFRKDAPGDFADVTFHMRYQTW